MEAGERERQLAYWTTRLGGEQPVLELPLDRPRPALQSWRGARLDIRELSAELGKGLQEVARQQGATLYMVLLASFQALLHRYSRQRDIRVGVPIGNRNRAETERLIGFFVNAGVLSAEVDVIGVHHIAATDQGGGAGARSIRTCRSSNWSKPWHRSATSATAPLFQVLFNHQAHRGEGRQAHELPGLRGGIAELGEARPRNST